MKRFIIACLTAGLALLLMAPMASTQEPGESQGPTIQVREPLNLLPINDQTSVALEGDVLQGALGDLRKENSGYGVRLLSGARKGAAGSMSFSVDGVGRQSGRWYRLRVRGLVQDHFHVKQDDLFLKVEFFKDGDNSLDFIKKKIFDQVEREREDFVDKGTNKKLGLATWRNYVVDFRTPFVDVEKLRVSVGFANGAATGANGEFWVSEVELSSIPEPADFVARESKKNSVPPALDKLVALGGRWYYDPRDGSRQAPDKFDHTNADRLYYLSDRLETPFANNMTAWLKKGYLERGSTKHEPNLVKEDRFMDDNVVVWFTQKHLVMKSKNLPNHPTAVFPDRWRLLDGNPNYIQEQDFTFYIPLEPKVNSKHVAMDSKNSNEALPGGPIGVMTNGIIFHNPFDERVYEDAVWRLDRCCGHPSPIQRYHYHKYPVCTNTPWDDQGEEHSPLIGFAFDGFPVYGPYEQDGELAKDIEQNPLNEFNVHFDNVRGWHYHVTPGKFPHLIGGFWGEVDRKNPVRR